MDSFINAHTVTGFSLLAIGVLAASRPTLKLSFWRLVIARLFFITLWIMGLGGILIGFYRHPASVSVFQVVTAVGLAFATIGLLALAGKLEGYRGQTRHYWYINGLGGSLIASFSASLFFIALTFFPVFYKANLVWFMVIFIAVPVILGRQYIAKYSK